MAKERHDFVRYEESKKDEKFKGLTERMDQGVNDALRALTDVDVQAN